MPTVAISDRVWLTGKQIANAIFFHLEDEGWFKEIPPGVRKWLNEQLPDSKRISFAVDQWRSSQTGTKRMLWLLTSSGLDPFILCKYAKDTDVAIMQRRFSDIIATWGGERNA